MFDWRWEYEEANTERNQLIQEVVRLRAELDELRAELKRGRVALGGYHDSDLVSPATTLRERCDYLEAA